MLSAEAARDMIEDKSVHVLKAKTVAQGYSALTMFDATEDIESNIQEMTDYLDNVKTGEITYAIRDSKNNGVEIKKDEYMGLLDGKIIFSMPTRIDATKTLVDKMVDDRSEIITIMYGKDVQEKEVKEIVEHIEDNHELEVDLIHGGQKVYSYIISVE